MGKRPSHHSDFPISMHISDDGKTQRFVLGLNGSPLLSASLMMVEYYLFIYSWLISLVARNVFCWLDELRVR